MAKQPINTLKNWFKTGLKPTEAQFAHWLDSFFHLDDTIPTASVTGLDDTLEELSNAILDCGEWDASGVGNLLPPPNRGSNGVMIKRNNEFYITVSDVAETLPAGCTIRAKQDNPTLLAHYRIYY